MPLPLVSLADLKAYLGGDVPAADDALLASLLTATVALLNRECHRERAPFSDALTARVEVQDACPGTRLRLDYPIAAVTSVKLGRNFASPDATLDPGNPDQLVFRVGERELIRTDGGYWDGSEEDLLAWQRGGELNGGGVRPLPTFVQVTYDTQADLPEEAALAVKSVAAALYRRRGSEAVKSEALGAYSYTLAEVTAGDPLWQAVVARERAARFEAR
jgi:hypothetical protein